MSAIAPVNGLAQSVETPSQAEPKLLQAAREFEAVFVRQMLKSSKFGGDDSANGYGAMIVESLAKSITAGDGLGLAKKVEQMLSSHRQTTASANGPDLAVPPKRVPSGEAK